jgi:Dickkopf N-terminal cysteine-rich region
VIAFARTLQTHIRNRGASAPPGTAAYAHESAPLAQVRSVQLAARGNTARLLACALLGLGLPKCSDGADLTSTIASKDSRTPAAIVAASRARFGPGLSQHQATFAVATAPAEPNVASSFSGASGNVSARGGREAQRFEPAHRGVARLGRVAADPFTVESGGVRVSVRLHGAQRVVAEQADGMTVYADALTGVDAMQRVSAEGTEDFLVFNQAPARAQLDYQLVLEAGAAGLRLVANTLAIVDAHGTPKLRVNPPYGVDANGQSFAVELSVSACAVDTDPRAPWGRPIVPIGGLACLVRVSWSPQVAYPALVDPAWGATGSMSVANPTYEMPVAKLDSGKVLAVSNLVAQLYDPETGTWAATGDAVVGMNHRSRIVSLAGNQAFAMINSGLAQVYNFASGTWKAVKSAPFPLEDGLALHALPNNRVLLAAATNGNVAIYDVTTDTYTLKTPANRSIGFNLGGTSIAPGKFAYIGGGVTRLSIYNLVGDSWIFPAAHALAEESANCADLEPLTNGKILAYGGGGGATNRARLFDPVTDTAQDVAYPNPATGYMCAHTSAISYGKVHLIGGGRFKYDEATGQITDLGEFASGALMHGAIVKLNDGRGLAIGGNQSYPSALVDLFAPRATVDCGDALFGSAATPSFDPASNRCQPCGGDNASAAALKCADPAKPACQAGAGNALAGQCTQCSASNAALCGGTRPRCDLVTGNCAGCNAGFGAAASRACAAATAPVCQRDGACIAAAVDRGVDAVGECPTAANPYVMADGSCGKCSNNADCAGIKHAGPTCEPASGACRAPCAGDGECTALRYCEAAAIKTCAPKKTNGAICTRLAECISGVCGAGTCGSVATVDAGPDADAARTLDANAPTDAAATPADAGPTVDAGPDVPAPASPDDGGCSCHISAHTDNSTRTGVLVAALAAAIARRRRRAVWR